MIVVSLIVVLTLSLLFIRVAAVALTLTGVSEELARFQIRSAFFGVGFTTLESESVVQHPVRRRLISVVMVLGHAVFATAVSALILSFMGTGTSDALLRLIYIGAGVLILWGVFASSWVNRGLARVTSMALRRWTKLEVRDYASLFHLSGNYAVTETLVQPKDWVADKSLSELDLPGEGILILGIQRQDGTYVGAPTGKTRIDENDTLILYGRHDVLEELDRRRAGHRGDIAHKRAVAEQEQIVKEVERQEKERAKEEKAKGK